VRRNSIWLAVFGLLALGFWMEDRTWKAANQLKHELESEQITDLNAAWERYQKLVEGTHLPVNLSGVRNALEARLTANADRVLAEYRESDFLSVHEKDWQQARDAYARALQLDPGDKSIRGKLRVCEGQIARINIGGKNAGHNLSEAQEKFQEAAHLLKTADPYLGLVHLDIYSLKDVDKAEQDLHEAERHNYRAGKRVKSQLADGYNDRADGWVREAMRASGLPQEPDYWKRADADYAHAADLYRDIAPWGNSVSMLRRIYNSREDVARRLTALNAPASGWRRTQ
jgi:tetratricopeptide (TPR) repeat protein